MNPSDYYFGEGNKGNPMYPRFLLKHGWAKYTFVGLHGEYAGQRR